MLAENENWKFEKYQKLFNFVHSYVMVAIKKKIIIEYIFLFCMKLGWTLLVFWVVYGKNQIIHYTELN